jgi:hypothetical protein
MLPGWQAGSRWNGMFCAARRLLSRRPLVPMIGYARPLLV